MDGLWPLHPGASSVNLIGQACSKLQDYAVYKLQINGNYHLARLCFDTLSNQSMRSHQPLAARWLAKPASS
mgnify:CR=1 FL=1